MKKTLIAVASMLAAFGAMAEDAQVDFTIGLGNSQTKITSTIGFPTSYSQFGERKSSCNFRDGDAKATMQFTSLSGTSGTVLPLERTATGVKALITFSKQSVANPETVIASVANDSCSVPAGSFSSVGVTNVYTLPWGQPTNIKLADNSILSITATK